MANLFVYVQHDFPVLNIEDRDVGVVDEHQFNSADESCEVFIIRLWERFSLAKPDLIQFDVNGTGDACDNKICNVCHKLLTTTNFALNQNGKNNRPIRRPTCQDCRKLLEGTYMPSKEKRKWAKQKPHHEPFECPICKKRTIAGVTVKVVLDHNHKTGEGRGWICDSCNTGIGRFKDDVELLKKAIRFLE